jgi:hypothetical protein
MKPQKKAAKSAKGPTARSTIKDVRQRGAKTAPAEGRSKTRVPKTPAVPAARLKVQKTTSIKPAVRPAAKQPELSKTEPVRRPLPRPAPIAAKSTNATKPPPKPASKLKEKSLNIPPILLEGDLPPAPKVTGPGTRYALRTPAPERSIAIETAEIARPGELPESYGTRRLFLTARDPRWLYASWDLTPEQQREYNRLSRDRHLILRVYAQDETSPVVPEVHVNPESRSFFINVPRPETRYWAELGFYSEAGWWERVSTSQSTFTPPDAPASEGVVEFATIPPEVPFEQVVQTVQNFMKVHQPLLEAVLAAQEAQEAQKTDAKVEPPPELTRAPEHDESKRSARRAKKHSTNGAPIPIRIERAQPWTPEQKKSLGRLISIDSYRRVWMGSIEITELVRRQLQEEIASIAAAELAMAAAAEAVGVGGALLNVSSPLGGEIPAKERKFWFKVNAELIIYGATEPDARVTIADRPIKLRPDGTFSFRFALPDGRYDLPALAASADGVEAREAILEFSRATEYRGHVEAYPQDSKLRPPRPEDL